MSGGGDAGGLQALNPFSHGLEWELSATVESEVQMQALLMMAGPQQAQLLEKYRKSKRSVRRYRFLQGFMIGVLLGLLTVIPVMALDLTGDSDVTGEGMYTTFNALSAAISGYYLLVLSIYLSFVMILTASFIKGDAFRFLSVLPISRGRMVWVVTFAFIRPHIVPLAVTFLALPIAGTAVTGSVKFLVASLVCNGVFLVFIIALLVVLAEVLVRRVFRESRSLTSTVMRVAFTGIYMFFTLSVFLFLGPMMEWVWDLFGADPSNITDQGMFIALALMPFPFAPASLVAISVFPSGMVATRVASVVGVLLFMALTFWLSLRAGRTFLDVAYRREATQVAGRSSHASPDRVVLAPLPPLQAFVRSSLTMVTRDVGRLGLLIMSLFLPIMVGFLYLSIGEEGVLLGFTTSMVYMGLMPESMNQAFAGTEMKMGGVLTSLPYRNWDLFRARRRLISGFMVVPLLMLFAFIHGTYGIPGEFAWYFLSALPFMVFLATFYLVMYSYLFGKVNEIYTLFEVNIEHRMAKRAVLIVVPAIIMSALYLGTAFFIGFTGTYWVGPVTFLWFLNLLLVFASDLFARKVFRGPSLSEELAVADRPSPGAA